jgi:hypothetical protein
MGGLLKPERGIVSVPRSKEEEFSREMLAETRKYLHHCSTFTSAVN